MARSRTLGLIFGLALLTLACTGPGPVSATSSAQPTASVDIKRAKLDVVYSLMADQDYHKASSRKILEGAIGAINAEIKKTGGKGEIARLDLQDVTEPVNPDFRKFADAAALAKALNPQITADRFADVAIEGMMGASPDCHTYYIDKNGGAHRSRPATLSGSTARVPTAGTSLGGPDESGLIGRLLPNGIVYMTFSEFLVNANYKFFDEIRKMMEKTLASGAKAWLFDLRGNRGGYDADYIASMFLNGEPMLKVHHRTGNPDTIYARKEWRLPDQYQKPVAIILNDRSGSGPEFFAWELRENDRATIVGSLSAGCLGSANQPRLNDNSLISVVATVYEGARTGAKPNNIGIPPDVPADDATAVDKAIAALLAKL
jgi:hypothetical protein